jgi:hypothetical protein
VIVSLAAALRAQPACSAPDERLMSWPAEDPVWQFCWLRSADSSGTNGSGIEIRDVYYKGHLVMKRGHVPIVNVQYDTLGSCGGANHCYRDYTHVEWDMLVDNVCPPPYSGTSCGYAEPACPPVTVCQQGLGVDVCGDPPPDCVRSCFRGVASQSFEDRLVLTTETKAGWYRYEIKWTFYLDGRFQPTFGFSAVADGCVTVTHRHHAYFRFDFDIDGPSGDIVTEGALPKPPEGKRGGRRPPIVVLPAETMRTLRDPGLTWSLIDSDTRRGYRIVPGAETSLAADPFAIGDVWLLSYNPAEIDDTGQSGPACVAKIGNYLNGEALSTDAVVWYRAGSLHSGGQLDDCHTVGPTFVPIGDWSP